ncbi:MAG: transcriptional regulator NrdR [Candidatus Cloacimonadota bacterium]|nr:MAG: transcriptional regulator NrdR [Candidatus Cloacimonadota bacterium]PIE78525.1 MAG: transcriptional regulator NrdR [Candidatus Delongbacteria bacterium]
MKCPRCSFLESKVIDSRSVKDGEAIRRRRSCLSCNSRFTTYEYVERSELYVIKSDSSIEEFDINKLKKGLNLALRKRAVDVDVDQISRDIYFKLSDKYQDRVKSKEIGNMVMQSLKTIDEVAYVRFASVYRKFTDVKEFMQEISKIMES